MAHPAPGTADASRRGSGGRSRLPGVVALLVVVGLTAVSWALSRPPQPVPATADPAVFSAERARQHLRAMAPDQPAPIGSAASDEVRAYLRTQLRALGLSVQVQDGVGEFTEAGQTAFGRVENVIATIPGREPTGRLVLSAHYDTTFGSPGAADDKAAVAALLESARALAAGPAPRNDIVILLTDGEEPGMLGASAFTQAMPSEGTDVVLNWEATGNAGPSALFEATPGASGLVEEYARWAQHPVGDSAMVELYRDSDQHTDLTVLQGAGFQGLNFALIEGTAYYHHSHDTTANLDPASLQHHGATMLAMARGLGSQDLTQINEQGDLVFFTAFGQIWTYPQELAVPLAALAALLVLASTITARARGTATIPELLAGAVAAVVPVLFAAGAAWGLWQLLVVARPAYGALFMGDPFRPEPYRWALIALVLATTLAAYLSFRRWLGPTSLLLGTLTWLAVLGVVTALWAPGASFYGALPAGAAAAAALLAPLSPPGWLRAGVLALGVLPGVVLLAHGAQAVIGVLGIAGGYAPAVMLAVAAGLLLPLVDLAGPGRPPPGVRWALIPAGAVVVLAVVGLSLDRFEREYPEPTHLSYVQHDEGATWVSTDVRPHRWTAAHAGNAAGEVTASGESLGGTAVVPLPYDARPNWTGPAAMADLPAPQVSILEVRQRGEATVARMHIASDRDAAVLVIHTSHPLLRAQVEAGSHTAVAADLPSVDLSEGQGWRHELRFYDPPPGGITMTVLLATGAADPAVYVSDYSVGLDGLPGLTPRPLGLDRSPAHNAEFVIVGTGHQL